jgi:tetratricopeptide (TPR) repeat protein
MTSQAQMAILGPQDLAGIQAMISGEKPSTPPKMNPRVFYFEAMALGRRMHPFEALEQYQWQIANRPGDPHLHKGLGNILRLLFRLGQALEELRFAYELAPQDTDILISLAMAEHDFGDLDLARQLYEKVLLLELQGTRASSSPSPYSQAALDGLEALKRNKPSPYQAPVRNYDGEPLPSQGRFASPASDIRGSGKDKQVKKRKR